MGFVPVRLGPSVPALVSEGLFVGPDIKSMEWVELALFTLPVLAFLPRQAEKWNYTYNKVRNLGLGDVDGLELVKLCPGAAQPKSSRLLHQAQLGIEVSLLLAITERVPIKLGMMSR